MAWWMWMSLGLVLAAVELATPGGFFVIFFGVAALVVGLLGLSGAVAAAWLQWLLFTAVALIALRLFRQPLLHRLGPGSSQTVDSLVDQVAIAIGDLPPGGHGYAELRGARWNARNVDTMTLVAGQRCLVVAVQGLTLDIRSE